MIFSFMLIPLIDDHALNCSRNARGSLTWNHTALGFGLALFMLVFSYYCHFIISLWRAL
jgi:hypothetical protein